MGQHGLDLDGGGSALMVAAWLCCGEIDFGLSTCDFFFLVLFGLESWCFLWVLWWVDLGRMRFGRFRDLGISDCLGMSLLLLAAEIQIQKSHLRWLLQNPPPMSISQIFFFIDGYDACGSVWLSRKSRNGKKFLGFLFCAVFAHSVQNLMGFCFWIGRLVGLFGCRENQEKMERNFWVFCFVLYLTRCKI
jgi:hypothetical protein